MHIISKIEIVPLAFADPPLINIRGVHEPFALRSLIRIRTTSGAIGYGESYGNGSFLQLLERLASFATGKSIYELSSLRSYSNRLVAEFPSGIFGFNTAEVTASKLFGALEAALLDCQAKIAEVPLWQYLGGKYRDEVQVCGYLFYKYKQHPGFEKDSWGEGINHDQIVNIAHRMVNEYGYESLKLKGGYFDPDYEAETIEHLFEAFPGMPLRLDPNCAWSVSTSIKIAKRLEGKLEYLEDPTPGIMEMAQVASETSIPLATNMSVINFRHLPEAIARKSVDIVLMDHHYWGGISDSIRLAKTCDLFGIDLSMHSNSHLSISLAAMVHLGAAVPNLKYAIDSHWPWKLPSEDVTDDSETLKISQGKITVPDGHGLGISIAPEKVAMLHENYLRYGLTERRDEEYVKNFNPDHTWQLAKW